MLSRTIFHLNKSYFGLKVQFIPKLTIYIVFFSIILSPIVKLGPFQLWQICSVFVLLINFKIKINSINSVVNFLPFIFYVFMNFLISINFDYSKLQTIRKLVLFVSVYIVFLILIIVGEKFKEKKDLYIKILNTIILIVCIYGIYQFIGRQIGLPFTLDEFLRFRKFRVAGFFQASSFFEEPAFFSQFLITNLFIHLFILEFKYKKIVLLMALNILFSLSVAGIISFFVILITYFFKRNPFKIKRILKRKELNRVAIVVGSILLFLVIIFNSQIPSYIKSRLKKSYVTEIQKQKIEKETLTKGVGVAYDVSGYLRVTNEIKTFINVLFSRNALWGYGINYEDDLPSRKMALNALTEIMVRWGLIGLLLFIIPIISILNTSKDRYSSFVYLLLFLFIDGAIAKLVFWFLLSLIIISINILNSEEDVVYNSSCT